MKARLKFGEKAIYGGRIYYYSEPKRIWYDGGHFNEWLGRAVHINMKKLESEIRNSHAIKEVNFITFCYVLIPKFNIQKIGLLDESYFMYVEDLDYSYKVWKRGYKLYHILSSRVYHKVGVSSGEDGISEFSAYWVMKNRIKFVLSYGSFFKILTALGFILLTRPIKFLQFWIRGNKHIIVAQVKGIKDGIK